MVHSTLVVQPGCHGRESVKTMSYTVTTMEAWDARSSLGHRRPSGRLRAARIAATT
jgi:hypothetical protein